MKPEESLSRRVVRGGVWIFTLRVAEKGLGLVRLVILARLLAPNDFGLFGIALLTMSAIEIFSQTGFQVALVQKKENIVNYLDPAWTVSVLRGIILFVLLFLLAPYIALFFNSVEATFIIRVIGTSILLASFTNIGIVYFQKELEFKRQFFYQLATTLADFVVAVSVAVVFKTVWALVFGHLARSLTGLVVSYLLHPYRPKFNLNLGKAKELFGFGKWVLGSSIVTLLITKGDDVIVGKLLGVTMLGFYQMAYKISSLPTTEITNMISPVVFPAYSKMQDNLPRLRESYLRVLQLTTFLSFPMAGLFFILAPDFTKIFLGEKWMTMVPAMQVLVIAGLVRSMAATTGTFFYAMGKPKIDTVGQIVTLLIIAVLIYPFTIKWGLLGASIAVLIGVFALNVVYSAMTVKITESGYKCLWKIIIPPLINGILLVSSIFFLKDFIKINGILGFFSFIAIGVLISLGITYLFDRYFNYRMYVLLKESLSSFTEHKSK